MSEEKNSNLEKMEEINEENIRFKDYQEKTKEGFEDWVKEIKEAQMESVFIVRNELKKYYAEKMFDNNYQLTLRMLNKMVSVKAHEYDGKTYCPRCFSCLSDIYVSTSTPIIGCPFCLQALERPVKVRKIISRKRKH